MRRWFHSYLGRFWFQRVIALMFPAMQALHYNQVPGGQTVSLAGFDVEDSGEIHVYLTGERGQALTQSVEWHLEPVDPNKPDVGH